MTIYTKHPEENVIISSVVSWDSFPKENYEIPQSLRHVAERLPIGGSPEIIQNLSLVEAQFLANYLSTLHGFQPTYRLAKNKVDLVDWNSYKLKNRVDRSVGVIKEANGYRLITSALNVKYPTKELADIIFGYRYLSKGLISWVGERDQHAYDDYFNLNPDCGFSMRVYRKI